MSKDIMSLLAAVTKMDDDEGFLDEDQQETLLTLTDMFTPYTGDDPATAQGRDPGRVHCHNCGNEWVAFYTPADLSRFANTCLRLAQCPRCYATEGVMMGGKK